ncbi:PREDICTED: F-BAR and double SH3 domains protein 1 [Gekko japonicus]|uniref:F-BAR and double SH3 domains protein 1 n=1 Tax=Gekko japonicus TaxID=146911 RepID=A0ABM1JYS7_GEKJA|nr:PREDICTED: F-BAR and double SH3 domains protein 1 [Gekko japonicus]
MATLERGLDGGVVYADRQERTTCPSQCVQIKPIQEVKVRFVEQLSSLQSKQQRELELLEDIRSYSKQRSAIEREYGQALQRLASPFLKREWLRGRSESSDCRSVFTVWKGVIDGTVCSGQARVAASDNYRTVSTEAAKTARVSKEHLLKKGIEQLLSTQAELLESVKEVGKSKKHYVQLQRTNEVSREKAADVEARLRRSDHGIFHTKGSLQKLSAKFSVQLAENSQQLLLAQNEYALMLVAVKAHLEHYYQKELPAVIQVCREQNLLLFLQDNAAFSPTAAQPFQPEGADQVVSLLVDSGLEKEARRWASRAAKDYKIQTVSEQVLQRMEARRQQVNETEMSGMEKRMEDLKENIRKAEVSKVKAEARLLLLRQAGLDVDPWLASAMGQVLDEIEQERRLSEARRSERGSTPAAEEFDPAEFEDYDDSTELFEDTRPSPGMTRTYPSSCRVFFPYQACQSDELTIVQGEELEVLEDGDVEEWVKARNQAGQVGYVPEKYLLFLDSVGRTCVVPDGGSQEGSSEKKKELTDLMLEPGAWLVRALYDYEGQSPEELSFPEGAIIRVLPREQGTIDDGFWKGDFNGRVGVFPSLVVHEIMGAPRGAEQDLPSPAPPEGSPPVLDPTVASPAEALVGGNWRGSTASEHSSPDLNMPRIRPVRAPPPPPLKAPEADSSPGRG